MQPSEPGAVLLAGRYRIHETLGRGGMGEVSRAYDERQTHWVALKRLTVPAERHAEQIRLAFKREFQTLSELAHPSVIEVYDYFVDEQGPFYTMQLLEGFDLRGQAPLPYRRVCALLHDVASSLSLLHTRRLVHRDVTAANIRIVDEEHAKLIDFGALAPMGVCNEIVGTPAYIAPEVALLQALDDRTDLYALGVVMYYALTRRYPYAARSARDLQSAWRTPPAPLDSLVADLPVELVRLVMSLLALDPLSRPTCAAEVMEHLAAIAGLARRDRPDVARAYLSTPTLVARQPQLSLVRDAISAAISGSGTGVLFRGPAGVGRSRMLDAAVLEAKLVGTLVARAAGGSAPESFGLAQSLLDQLWAEDAQAMAVCARAHWPQCTALFPGAGTEGPLPVPRLGSLRLDRSHTISAVSALLFARARERGLVITIDDASSADDASLALLATCLDQLESQRVLILLADGTSREQPSLSLRLIDEQCRIVPLEPLDASAMLLLVRSLFGRGDHREALAQRMHAFSSGLPREAMALAEHLVAHGIVQYRAGGWVLPARLDGEALPADMAAALRERLTRLSAFARNLAELLALSGQRSMRLHEWVELREHASEDAVHSALDELLAIVALCRDGSSYAFAHAGWSKVLVDGMDADARARHHLALANRHERTGKDMLAAAYHMLFAGRESDALATIDRFATNYTNQAIDVFDATNLRPSELAQLFVLADRAGERRGLARAPRSRLYYFKLVMGLLVDPAWFIESMPLVESELSRDSGADIWEKLDPQLPPLQRTLLALQQAQAAFEATPEPERGFPPADAIRMRVQYALAMIAIATKTADVHLQRRLPKLLLPFAALSPVLEAVQQNCAASEDNSYNRFERARERYLTTLDKLSNVDAAALPHIDQIRDALISAAASREAEMGLPGAAERASLVMSNPRQASLALRIQAAIALQQGDWATSKALRRAADQRVLESELAPIFGDTSLMLEARVYAIGLDLHGVGQHLDRMEAAAEGKPGFAPHLFSVRASQAWLRGDLRRALALLDDAITLTTPADRAGDPDTAFYGAMTSKIEVLLELGQCEQAHATATHALGFGDGQASGVRYHGIRRAYWLCEAKLGRTGPARVGLEALLAEREAIGSTCVFVGLIHEALTLVATWSNDEAAASRHLAGAQRAYLASPEAGFARRYHRLCAQLPRMPGVVAAGESAEPGVTQATVRVRAASPKSVVAQQLSACRTSNERAMRALRLLCEQVSAPHGRLYLRHADRWQLMAATSDAELGREAEEFIRAWCDHERVDAVRSFDLTTVLTQLGDDRPASGGTWTDSAGRVHQVVALRAATAAGEQIVGMALLEAAAADKTPPRTSEYALALGEYLLSVGDCEWSAPRTALA